MILGFIDLETTGLKAEDGHRMTEIALILKELTSDGKLIERGQFSTLIDPQRSIPAEIQELTGINHALVHGCPTWDVLAPKIDKILKKVDVLIAHNVAFDAPFLGLELVRLGYDVPKVKTFCTMQNGRFATSMGNVPRLSVLCWSLDVEFDTEAAHRAIYDTEKLAEAFAVGYQRGLFVLDSGESDTKATENAA